MMRSKPSSRNLASRGRFFNALLLLPLLFFCGCSSSTQPTYLQENAAQAIEDICLKEYKLDVRARQIGKTIWVYLPLDSIFVQSEKPEKYIERFSIQKNDSAFVQNTLKVDYNIWPIPEKTSYEQSKLDKSFIEKYNYVLKAVWRVLLSMERKKETEPQFLVLVAADIKNGFEVKETVYCLDLKKMLYQFISHTEYRHRAIQDINVDLNIIGDKLGLHLVYKDVALRDFIASQIRQRTNLKFQKPEVEKNADIDKEILKIAVNTLKIYGFRDFKDLELQNLATRNKIILNEAAVWEEPAKE